MTPLAFLSCSTPRIRRRLRPELTRLLFGRPAANIDRNLHLPPLPADRDTNAVARRDYRHRTDQPAGTVDAVAVDRHHDVAGPQTRPRRRPIAVQAGDGDTAVAVIDRYAQP